MTESRLALGEHWDAFVQKKIEDGHYGSADEVIRDALRDWEDRDRRLQALRAHLAEGEAQSAQGEYIEDYSIEKLLAEADREE
ncbi:MAG: type II toxin-antitoxin system ParD family antitoxin [Alphaproteobacteria bacterium]|nr:type II toxin-antitoxin system ParD family antitoxin [Alphaproteobacteria bacterium]